MKIPRAQPRLLPDEVITEMLSWLPVKSLLRFRCVSKSWRSLISDPHFVKLHLERSKINNASLMLTLKHIPFHFVQTDIHVMFCTLQSLLDNPSSTIGAQHDHHPLKNKYWVLGSCNGLVCLIGDVVEDDHGFGDYWVRFWNPATRLTSQKSPFLRVDLRINQFGATKFGFGYDKLSDTYKVVAVLSDTNAREGSQRTTQVKVYCMGDNCWRNIQSFPAFPTIVRNEGRFLSGTLNWLAIRNFGFGYHWDAVTVNQLVIVSLDLGKETYKQLLLPDGLDEVPYVEPTIGVLRDCLCLFHDYKRTHFVVWQMNEFGVKKSWTQFVSVSYQHLQIEEFWTQFYSVVPLCISENGDVLILGNNDLEIILYYRRDNRVERTKFPYKRIWINAKDYVPSLVRPC